MLAIALSPSSVDAKTKKKSHVALVASHVVQKKTTKKAKVIVVPQNRPQPKAHKAYRGDTFAGYFAGLSVRAQACVIKKFTAKKVQAWEADSNATLTLSQIAQVERCRK